jgi:hypothetical protein
MNFLYPSFLWALTALSIPVIIHLFNFKRYKTVYFSNNRFLQAIQKKSQSFNRLKHWVILITRLLALALLVFAFTQPFIPSKEDQTQNNFASVYIDNSLSMTARGLQSSLLDEAREKAVQLIESLPKNFKIQILTNNFDGKEQRYYSGPEAIELIDEIKPSYAFRTTSDVHRRMLSSWENINQEEKGLLQAFMISDFQKSQTPGLEIPNFEDWKLNLLRLERANESSNIAIDSVWFESPVLQPGFDQEVKVRVRNYGSEKMEDLSINLEVNKELIGASEFELGPKSQKELAFVIRPKAKGDFKGKLEIESGEPYFDNTFYFSYQVKDPINILVIGEQSDLFQKLYQDSVYSIDFSKINQLNYGELNQYNLIVLNQPKSLPSGLNSALQQHLQANGNIVLIPNLEDIEVFNSILQSFNSKPTQALKERSTAVSRVVWDDPLFENVFTERPKSPQLPRVSRYLPLSTSFPILVLEDGVPIINRLAHSNGQILVFGTDFNKESGNLARHPIIVPIMLNIALYSQPKSPLYNLAGTQSGQQFKRAFVLTDEPVVLNTDNGDLIPPQRNKGVSTEIHSLPSSLKPGTYPVLQKQELIGNVAVNINSNESDWRFWDSGALSDKADANENLNALNGSKKNLASQVSSIYNGYPLWQWFLVGALLFLCIETLLLKLWK